MSIAWERECQNLSVFDFFFFNAKASYFKGIFANKFSKAYIINNF